MMVTRIGNLESTVSLLVVKEMRNTAAQVMRQAAEPDFCSSKFSDLGAAGDARLQLLKELACFDGPVRDLIRLADGMITKGNNTFHHCSAEELEACVAAARKLLQANPSVRSRCSDACWVIDNYEHIKKAFPNLG